MYSLASFDNSCKLSYTSVSSSTYDNSIVDSGIMSVLHGGISTNSLAFCRSTSELSSVSNASVRTTSSSPGSSSSTRSVSSGIAGN